MAPAGYISPGVGAKRISTPSVSSNLRSCSKVRGYLARSSLGPNCRGLTKIETATTSHFAFAARTSERCPSCNAPMVGTKPRRFWSWRDWCEAARMSAMVLQIFIVRSGILVSGGWNPVYEYFHALQRASGQCPVLSKLGLVFFGARGTDLLNCNYAPIGPGRHRQLSKRFW